MKVKSILAQTAGMSFALVFVAIASATLVRIALTPLIGDALPFITYFLANLFIVWFRGFKLAVIHTIVSAIVGAYFFLAVPGTPVLSVIGHSPANWVTVGGFIVVSLGVSYLLDLQRKTLRRLGELNASLERANEDLKRFTFLASHDLQEPLRIVGTFSQLLLKRFPNAADPELSMFVDTIVGGTKRMRELIAGLLAYAEIGERKQELELVDLNSVLEWVRETLKSSLEECGAVVTSDPLCVVAANRAHMASLFQNLIGNSIKYRGLQPLTIHISVQELKGEFRFSFVDNGIGIDPEYHDQIFRAFKRLHTNEIPGTGIGLAMCKRLAELYGGRIWVESSAGAGATFLFTLPTVGNAKSVLGRGL